MILTRLQRLYNIRILLFKTNKKYIAIRKRWILVSISRYKYVYCARDRIRPPEPLTTRRKGNWVENGSGTRQKNKNRKNWKETIPNIIYVDGKRVKRWQRGYKRSAYGFDTVSKKRLSAVNGFFSVSWGRAFIELNRWRAFRTVCQKPHNTKTATRPADLWRRRRRCVRMGPNAPETRSQRGGSREHPSSVVAPETRRHRSLDVYCIYTRDYTSILWNSVPSLIFPPQPAHHSLHHDTRNDRRHL